MKLQDDSKMPWGKFKGENMEDVPAKYLMWCFDNNTCCNLVKEYVKENYDVLMQEIKKSQR